VKTEPRRQSFYVQVMHAKDELRAGSKLVSNQCPLGQRQTSSGLFNNFIGKLLGKDRVANSLTALRDFNGILKATIIEKLPGVVVRLGTRVFTA
jgi:hypothetical protein